MKRTITILTIVFTVAGTLSAQSTGSETLELTLEEAVERALASSHTLSAGDAATDAQRAIRAQATAARYPALDVEVGYMRLMEQDPATIDLSALSAGSITLAESIENSYSATVSLRQPLFTGGEINARINAANHTLAASHSGNAWDRSGVALQAHTAYWELVETELQIQTLEERVRQVEANLRTMQRREQNGVVTRSDVLYVEMELADAQLQLLRARNNREIAHARLALLADIPVEREILPITPLPEQDATGNDENTLAELLDEALASRGDLQEYRSTIEAAEATQRAARAGLLPDLFLAGNFTWARPNEAIFPVEDEFASSWSLGIVGRMEVGALPRVYHESEQRAAEVRRAESALGAAEQRVRLAVREAYLIWQSSDQQLELARVMVRQAEENLTETRSRVENGVALNDELLDAQATLLQARLSLTSSITGRQIAWERLMRETGREL